MAEPLFYTEVKIVNDGTIYEVTDIQNSNAKFARPADAYLTLGDDVAFELKRHLNAGNVLTIPIADVESKGEENILFEDFTIKTLTSLEKRKAKKFHKVQNIFTLYLTKMGSLAFFNLLYAFSGLASRGYFITDDNREEKYLEIINSGDDELITLLENYLEEYDLVKPIASMYADLKKFEIDLEAATTKEEIDEAAHMFETAT